MMIDYQKIKLVVLDVDGTLTDGGIYYDSQGKEMKRFDVKDGLGIKVGISAGLNFAILTGRKSSIVEQRVNELGIQYLYTGIQVKYPVLIDLLTNINIKPEECCYIGDDLNDLQCMEAVGFRMCTADATREIQEICHYISSKSGGHGAVRDCIEYILTERKEWSVTANKLYYSSKIEV